MKVVLLLTLFAGAFALEFPACNQLNSLLCTTDRIREMCPELCNGNNNQDNNDNDNDSNNSGGGGGGGGGSSSNDGDNHVTTKPKEPTTQESTDNYEEETDAPEDEEQTTTKKTSKTKKPTTKKHATTKASHGTGGDGEGVGAGSSSKCDKITPCVDKATANEGFRARCVAKNLKESCWSFCRYDVTFEEIKKATLGGQCPIATTRDYLQAAANGNDNRGCCDKTQVTAGKLEFCFPFCNPTGDVWPSTKEALKYLPCSGQMSKIMQCHWAGIEP